MHNVREGDKVVFTGKHGYDWQLDRAKSLLEVGKAYVVAALDISEWSSNIYLKEFDEEFNSVHFETLEDYKKFEAPALVKEVEEEKDLCRLCEVSLHIDNVVRIKPKLSLCKTCYEEIIEVELDQSLVTMDLAEMLKKEKM